MPKSQQAPANTIRLNVDPITDETGRVVLGVGGPRAMSKLAKATLMQAAQMRGPNG